MAPVSPALVPGTSSHPSAPLLEAQVSSRSADAVPQSPSVTPAISISSKRGIQHFFNSFFKPEWDAVKGEMKDLANSTNVESLVRGLTPEEAKAELTTKLREHINNRAGLSEKQIKKANDYTKRKARQSLISQEDECTKLSTKGTTLPSPLFRRNGVNAIFAAPKKGVGAYYGEIQKPGIPYFDYVGARGEYSVHVTSTEGCNMTEGQLRKASELAENTLLAFADHAIKGNDKSNVDEVVELLDEKFTAMPTKDGRFYYGKEEPEGSLATDPFGEYLTNHFFGGKPDLVIQKLEIKGIDPHSVNAEVFWNSVTRNADGAVETVKEVIRQTWAMRIDFDANDGEGAVKVRHLHSSVNPEDH